MLGKNLSKTMILIHSLGLVTAFSSTSLQAANPEPTAPLDNVTAQWGIVEEYCLGCHNFEDWAGSLALDTYSPNGVAEDPEVWEKVIKKLRGRLMPPPGNPRPATTEIDSFISSLENSIDHAHLDQDEHPGQVALHRLNRTEYANEIKRLLDLEVDTTTLLPPDTRSEGFDNVANVLQVSPTFLDQYISSARAISIQAVGASSPTPGLSTYEAADQIGQFSHVHGLPLGTRGGFQVEHYFPAAGDYALSIRLSSAEGSLLRSYPTGWLEYENTLIMTIDGNEVFRENIGGRADLTFVDQQQQQAVVAIQERFNQIPVQIAAGPHSIGVTFLAKTFAESDRKIAHLLPGLGMDSIPLALGVSVLGPFAAEANASGQVMTRSQAKIFSCFPANSDQENSCANQIIEELAQQAFRRPLNSGDRQTLMNFYQAGYQEDGFEAGIQKSIMAILASPKFLYRAEALPEQAKPGDTFALSDIELASRLSFFLWSQGPDDELITLAEQQQLRSGSILEAQVKRMLADPKSRSLIDNFAMQWLRVGDIDAINPDPRIFPEFDATLRSAFKEELALFIESILLDDRNVLELLTARHSFVNERLARHYDLPEVRGDRFRKIELEDSQRWGLLGKSGVLMLTSYPNRTSPVLRGAYIMETLIGVPPSAPPAGVETDLEDAPGVKPTTVRDRLAQHRANPSCNQCHGIIDPLGLALENFDAIGKWRYKDRWANQVIDSAGELVDGSPIAGMDGLRETLMARPDQFVQTFTEKLMTYALGRTIEYSDMPVIRKIVAASETKDYRFSALIQAIVETAAFQQKSVGETADDQLALTNK